MDQNQPTENILQTPPKKTSRLRTALILACLVLALLLLKLILILTAKPKLTVYYVQDLNRITKPQNYDPNKNAADIYQKAFDAFVEMPTELRKPYITWPTDYNSTNQALLEKWLISNTLAFDCFKAALNKPYYWIERKSQKDNYIGRITSPDLAQLRELAETLGWDAKLKAAKGKSQTAFENILDCYRAGNHKCHSNLLLMEQHAGLNIKKTAVKNALVIVDRSEVDNKTLKLLQDNLKQELDRNAYIPGIRAEKLWQYDTLQRTFIDNGKGTGRLWWRLGFDVVVPVAFEGKIYERKIKMSCFTGPTRKQVVEQIEQTSALFDQLIAKTPWQTKHEGRDYLREIDNINKRYFALNMLDIGIIDPTSIFRSYYETRAQTEALIAVLAILRHKADTGQFPESLDNLVFAGYLEALPNNPYSDGPLVYKLTEDNFKLYSVGKDFSDNGGTLEIEQSSPSPLPGEFRTKTSCEDIIYWPVKHPEKPKPIRRLPLMGFPPSSYEPNQEDN
jgi:hypothetical protein